MLSSSAIPVTVDPVANAKEVLNVAAPLAFNVPSTTSPSFILTVVESEEDKVVPLNCMAPIETFPVPFGCMLILPLVTSVVI